MDWRSAGGQLRTPHTRYGHPVLKRRLRASGAGLDGHLAARFERCLQERLFDHLGIPADRWDWLTTEEVPSARRFLSEFPGYGEYVDPPYTMQGHVVRGGPGWIVMSAEDLARFGLLSRRAACGTAGGWWAVSGCAATRGSTFTWSQATGNRT